MENRNIVLDSDLEFLPDDLDGLSVLASALYLSCKEFESEDIGKALSLINQRIVTLKANAKRLLDTSLILLDKLDKKV
ncbi:hypothetical protein CSUB8523_1759 [Campylobacter subantarcticus LMG 24377]|uniref:Uncharacterized protein n=1 Tax=Campylobacter subantarcticus TaxID=497724 RepID=A0ABW9N2T2_9BACT|nr:hypothetical protein [Campylobacter subantarcticus]AJC93239.1 hypothetical protein CSUB8523_1759 [Campylobacter subantarcticus LMG 24377]EAL3939614.1 hypothetical protein [Campylobacter lari]MPB98570.1 hypothetical protein [Campylobacter subantarcticus]